ncbi:hypothetical protein RHSP_83229 [Rhizobium freirei PRF 81]|uniref:Uncharacterized protein n=1 Tax=Rhizobium freirei PRF 81 TaxID=363754 RepID=N6V0Q6_9HYPH|nr:hypothetical protein [Rhizobium freirei]ENN84717.1 hypothetical protein RHSP_83229 [Rhizobium freirei PRF 81]
MARKLGVSEGIHIRTPENSENWRPTKGGCDLREALPVSNTDIDAGLNKREEILRPMTEKRRRLAWFKSQIFVPPNGVMFILRRIILRFGGRYISKLARGSGGSAQADRAAFAECRCPQMRDLC